MTPKSLIFKQTNGHRVAKFFVNQQKGESETGSSLVSFSRREVAGQWPVAVVGGPIAQTKIHSVGQFWHRSKTMLHNIRRILYTIDYAYNEGLLRILRKR